ncbi:hypothetical protein SAMN05428949_1865 [Chitinophaga sp. YR627]|uniref:hypothetical protein n=1 Tax=Chitinophaga sp. YR627 TaxID=1881041 RepID=UPI0008E32A8A|nr:hypothetical protein [Chitinophaga sp. YR627]SFN19509.1 hypothetical protein SAMN05428949_1865 [Chitinophaga sp. YR627]
MNFFDAACQEPPLSHVEFGLCDDQNTTIAYTDVTDKSKWVATVKNENALAVTFTAIDKCVIKDNEHVGRGRCDAMLTTTSSLFLVELKDAFPPWQAGALAQLVSTIEFLKAHHNIDAYTHKKIFACNKKRAGFVAIDNEENKAFFREHRFRMDIQAEIIVVK